nr:MAG TPA: hypothetical protein [Caudoviricetes sp.]
MIIAGNLEVPKQTFSCLKIILDFGRLRKSQMQK